MQLYGLLVLGCAGLGWARGLIRRPDGTLTLSSWGVLCSVTVITLLALLLVVPVNRPGRLPGPLDAVWFGAAYLLPLLATPAVLWVARTSGSTLSWGALAGLSGGGLLLGWGLGHVALVLGDLVPFRI